MCSHSTPESAAQRGDMALLKWIHAILGNEMHLSVLQQAALHSQQHVMGLDQ